MTIVADITKGQTYMSYKGELQTVIKLSLRHQVCPSETERDCSLPGSLRINNNIDTNQTVNYYAQPDNSKTLKYFPTNSHCKTKCNILQKAK